MDNLDDSENNAKISDSAYSNSCSNSQSRRSHSSKSTHSGSSGSSGYGGKPSTSGSSNKLEQTSKKDKDAKKKKLAQTEVIVVEEPATAEFMPPAPIPQCDVPEEVIKDVFEKPTPPLALPEKAVENTDYSQSDLVNHKHETPMSNLQTITTVNLESSCQIAADSTGFSCVISMHDGVVMYTTHNLTANLGFPKDMWIGRSFIDFVHPKDRNTLASQITNGLAVPKIINYTPNQVQSTGITDCAMVCRIRCYRSLKIGFGVKDRMVAYMPFMLRFSFKDINEDDGKTIYLIIQATPICSGYKVPNECKTDATPFIIRHSATGLLEYIDIESVPYLGYIPQDIQNKDALLLYHPDDLPYLKMIYETIVKEGNVAKSMPYRMMTQNGDYVKLESEWSSFINPWSMKLEFVIGKHYVVEGPATPDVFMSPPAPVKPTKTTDDDKIKTQLAETIKESILRILKDVLTKPAEKAKQQMSKRCHDLALIMENLLEDQPKTEEELRVEIQEPDFNNSYERDSVMLGGISPHHEYNDSKSSTGTPLSYNQLNYNENLQRYFDSHQNFCFDENNTVLAIIDSTPKSPSNCLMSPMAQNSAESNDMDSSGSSAALMCNTSSPPAVVGDVHVLRLTESLLTKHNNDMEKELAKYHRGARVSSKGERSSETRQKKKEHLARCNATYQPTMAGAAYETQQPHGVKRSLMPMEVEIAHKQHCTQARQARRRQTANANDNVPHTATNPADAHNTWQDGFNPPQTNTIPNTMGMHQQVPMLPLVPGAFPMYYAPNTEHNGALIQPRAQPATSLPTDTPQTQFNHLMTPALPHQMPQYTNAPMPWMYPQPVYGTPYIYPQVSYLQQQQVMPQPTTYNQSLNPLGLPNSNYMQVAETMPELPKPKKREAPKRRSPTSGQNSDETLDKTDGESSFSSFYSSFFKTESGSAEDSSDLKKARSELHRQKQLPCPSAAVYTYEPPSPKKAPRRQMDPPWLNQVCVTSELVYKYQIPSKPKEEVLRADLEKMKTLEQPALVNEQLEQLYMDLKLDGVVSRLTLEEGITSSSSSGDETCFSAPAVPVQRRKREYSQLNMIYEEDAPLPPPTEEACKEDFSQIDVS